MNAASVFRDITAFSIQIAIVALVVALLVKMVRIPARARYLSLRLALAAALVAPWLLRVPEMQVYAPSTLLARTVSLMPLTTSSAPRPTPSTGVATTPVDSTPAIPWTQVGLGALLVGVVARTIWLAVGMIRLLRLARQGTVIETPEYSELQQQLGTSATIVHVAGLSQPATFGIRRPIVLLPDALAEAAVSLRSAVVTHELFHVRRRDWLCVLGEEVVRTALWFHPAILWLTSHIQLAREEIVDELAVRATGDRRTYVEALVAFADTPGLTPAPAFAHRRQLFHRILSVSKEKVMSKPRIASSAAVVIAAVAGASWYASTLFPIVKAAKVEDQRSAPAAQPARSEQRIDLDGDVVLRDGNLVVRGPDAVVTLDQRSGAVSAVEPVRPVTPENPIPRRTRGVAPVRPSRFADLHVVVSPLVTLDRNGTVMSVARDACEVFDGRTSTREDVCDAFFEPTAAAIRQWRYERPAQGPIQFYVHVRYQPGAEPAITHSAESYKAYARDRQESQRALQEERLREEARELKDRAAALIDRSRELERAQRLLERGLLANSDLAALQADRARLNAEVARAEEQLRSVGAQGTANDQARVEAQVARANLVAAERRLEEQYRAGVEQRARAEDQARSASETLREAERRLAEYQREREQKTTAELSREPAPPNENLRPLVSPSGRAPVQTRGANGERIPGLQMPVVTKSPKPAYPPEAKEARLQGTVVLEALVDEGGRVADARVMRGISQLDQAALDTAKQWEFRPATLDGKPVPVIVVLEMDFTLK